MDGLLNEKGGQQVATLARTIKPIDTQAVHKICSGQVVLTLATAVKELVENSLDAGSTSVEINLKEYGVESIEVIDNGCGVEEHNFEALTLKHHTSKLSDFEDLANVNTFGFRGEALSSLCCLGNLSITTCHKNSSVGQKLEFDHRGKLCKQTAFSRPTGTTVTIRNLFSTLPVRHKEFVKNIKREYAKMLQVLYAYCLVTDARISCANKIGQSKSVVVATQGQNTPKENICNVFGPKQTTTLLEFQQHPISQTLLCEYNLKDGAENSSLFCISGFVSSCKHGSGRSSADRQFYYINGRPCDLTKLSKVVNEVYHSYNRHQYPFVMLNVTLSRESVDINVTPDKRLLFIENEKVLLAIVKSSLNAMFESLGSIIQSSQPVLNDSVSSPTSTIRDFLAKRSANPGSDINSTPNSQINKAALFSLFKRNKEQNSGLCKRQRGDNGINLNYEIQATTSNKQPRLENYFLNKFKQIPQVNSTDDNEFVPPVLEDSTLESEIPCLLESVKDDNNKLLELPSTVEKCNQTSISGSTESNDGSCDDKDDDISDVGNPGVACTSPSELPPSHLESIGEIEFETDVACGSLRKSITMPFSLTSLRERLKQTNDSRDKQLVRRFRAKIDPGDNSAAEEELTKEISKDSFRNMQIIGQFNLGFIVAKLDSDLFVIDQHATDEKYNFEMLRKNTILDTQPLIRPLSMELTAMNETILLENHETFRKNGFTFKIDEQGKPGQRVKLLAVPMSKNWSFGKEDIEEMLFMLSEAAPGVMCRPSRIQEMFASRACRMSVMIGTPLSQSDMRKLVLHMGEMDQPWNCPHQRPTIRHLINLDMLNV